MNSMSIERYKTEKFIIPMLFILLFIIGGYLGGFCYDRWQDATEISQYLAGNIPFPPANIQASIFSSYWFLPAQIGAIILWSGATEVHLSILYSFLAGGLYFSSLGLITWSFTKKISLSISTPFIIWMAMLSNIDSFYDISLFGSGSTGGALAFSMLLLILSLQLNKYKNLASLFFGLLLSIHISFFVFLCLAWSLSFFFVSSIHYKDLFSKRWLFIGLILSSISIFFTTHTQEILPGDIDTNLQEEILSSFIMKWDIHRQKISFFSAELLLNLAIAVICYFKMKKNEKNYLIFYIYSLLSILYLLFQGIILDSQVPAMSSRLLNLNLIVFFPLLISLFFHRKSQPLNLLFHHFFWTIISAFLIFNLITPSKKSTLIFYSLYFLFFILLGSKTFPGLGSRRKHSSINAFLLIILTTLLFIKTDRETKDHHIKYSYYKNNTFFKEVNHLKGQIIACPTCEMISLKTGRPVLLNPDTIDDMNYVKSSSIPIYQLLKEIYGVDLIKDSGDYSHTIISDLAVKRVWEQRTSAKWGQISKKYNASTVMTPLTWKLKLPSILGSGYRAYIITPTK